MVSSGEVVNDKACISSNINRILRRISPFSRTAS